jgi:hypothetical protein
VRIETPHYPKHIVPQPRCVHCREPYDGTEQLCAVDDKTIWLHARCQRPYLEAP